VYHSCDVKVNSKRFFCRRTTQCMANALTSADSIFSDTHIAYCDWLSDPCVIFFHYAQIRCVVSLRSCFNCNRNTNSA